MQAAAGAVKSGLDVAADGAFKAKDVSSMQDLFMHSLSKQWRGLGHILSVQRLSELAAVVFLSYCVPDPSVPVHWQSCSRV